MQIQDSLSALPRQTFFTEESSFIEKVFSELWLPPQSSTTAHEIDSLFYFILYTSLALTLIVAVAMVYFVWKYRRKSHADRAVDVHESKLLELSWIVIPTLLVLVVFFWGFTAYVSTSIPPDDSYTINVQGQKWFWSFEYPNGKQTSNEIVVPVNTPIRLEMTSQDVLHSFFVPAFRIKHDVVPNRYSYVWFEAPEEGTYQVVCTEYCGTQHSNMGALIRVVGYQDFAEWVGSTIDPSEMSLVEYGERLYEAQACNNCHSVDGSDMTGPTWLGTWGETRPFTDGTSAVMDSAYVVESILYPGNKIVQGYLNQMPSYQGKLDDVQLSALIAFMKDINGAATPAELTRPGEGGATGEDLDAGPEATPGEGPGAPSDPMGLSPEGE